MDDDELAFGLAVLGVVRTFSRDPSGAATAEVLRALDREALVAYAHTLALLAFTSAGRLGEQRGQTVDEVIDDWEATLRQNEANRRRFDAEDQA